jgi:hypothetical protein
MKLIDESFEQAFLTMDFLTKEITHCSLKQKIKTLEIISKSVNDLLKLYYSESKYRNEIYKDFQKV